MKTIISCKYSKLIYTLLKIVDEYLLSCKHAYGNVEESNILSATEKTITYFKCISYVHDRLKSFYDDVLSLMIFTLVDFEKYRNNFVSGKQDHLNILLSLYLHLKFISFMTIPDDGKFPDNELLIRKINRYGEDIKIIRIQMEIALREFSIQNCQRQQNFTSFTKNLNMTFQNKSDSDLLVSFKEVLNELLNYTTRDKINSVFNTDGKHSILIEEIQNNTQIRVEWNDDEWLSLEEVYAKYVSDTTILQNVLRYENILLSVMSKLIHGKVVSELAPLFSETTEYSALLREKFTKISDTLQIFLEDVQQKLPKILFSYIVELAYRVNRISTYYSSPERSAQALLMFKQLESENKIPFIPGKSWTYYVPPGLSYTGPKDAKTLIDFLQKFVMKNIGNTYLNRDIINLINDKAYVIVSQPFEYAVDFKNIYTNWRPKFDVNDKFCQTDISQAEIYANKALESIIKCDQTVEVLRKSSKTSRKVEKEIVINDFNVFNQNMSLLKDAVVELLLQAYDHEGFVDIDSYLRKMFLTLIYNSKHVSLFENNTQLTMNNRRIQDLINFQSGFKGLLNKYHLLVCEKSLKSDDKGLIMNQLSADRQSDLMLHVKNTFKSYVDKVKDTKPPKNRKAESIAMELKNDTNFGMYFDTVDSYRAFVTNNLITFHGRRIQFLWNGKRQSVWDIHKELRYGTFDIQRLVEYQYMTLNWVFSWVFSAMLNVLNGLLYYGLGDRPEVVQNPCFRDGMNALIALPVHRFSPQAMTTVIGDFVYVLDNCCDVGLKLEHLRTVVVDELMMFGVVLTSLPNAFGKSTEEYVEHVCAGLDILRGKEFTSLFDTVGLKQILGEKKPFEKKNDELRLDVNW